MLTVEQCYARCQERGLNPKWNGKGGFECFCPAHGDTRTRHLYIKQGYKALVCWCAHGCGFTEIAAAMGMERREWQAPDPTRRLNDGSVTHDYRDAMGRLVYQTWRKGTGKGKQVRRRRPDPASPGEWIWNLQGVELILYRLPEIVHGDPAAVVLLGEGEKVADTLSRTGNPATTNVGGAKQWRDHYADTLIGRRVAVFPDCDDDGEFWTEQVTASLKKRAIRFGVVRLEGLSEGQDAYDWLRMGHEPAELLEKAYETLPELSPLVVSVVKQKQRGEPPDELEPEALYGLPGEIVLTIEPYTESHPAAILGSLITAAGCVLGTNAYVYRDGARHHANEFCMLVGLTGAGRKGSGSRRVDEVFQYLCGDYYNSNYTTHTTAIHAHESGWSYDELIVKGLGSGEALVKELAEDERERRRLVFEGEFSKALKVMARDGSTLSETLRDAWDGSVLANVTKGKRLVVKGAHISVLGHVTQDELSRRMGQGELWNGFANRFLWFWTRRTKFLPFGGGHPPLSVVVRALHDTLKHAKSIGEMEFDAEAAQMWDQGGLYELLSTRPANLFGAVTSRAEAHVTRLALLYAVLDAADAIRVPHLLAALAVWHYSEQTSRYLFGDNSGDDYADTILELLEEAHPGGLTRQEIRDGFHRNAPPGRIPQALALLEETGRAERVQQQTERGRPPEFWRLKTFLVNDGNDEKTKIPLFRARKLAQEIRDR